MLSCMLLHCTLQLRIVESFTEHMQKVVVIAGDTPCCTYAEIVQLAALVRSFRQERGVALGLSMSSTQ